MFMHAAAGTSDATGLFCITNRDKQTKLSVYHVYALGVLQFLSVIILNTFW